MSDSLLPPNATALELAVERVLSHSENIPVKINTLWSAQDAPENTLPWLAWAMSVDSWSSMWTTAEKRAAIQSAPLIHRHKGTISSVRNVVEPLGFLIEIVEAREKVPPGPPHTFEVVVGVRDKGITDEMYSQMSRLIDDVKPCRSRLIGLDVQAEALGSFSVSAGIYCGDATTVYPYEPGIASIFGVWSSAATEHTIDNVSVYPL